MDIIVSPSRQISGEVYAPPSKSYAHRYIISAFLSKESGFIEGVGTSKDVYATLNALSSIGLEYKMKDNGVEVHNTGKIKSNILDCNESGSTIRFLFPVISALGIKAEFTGSERLLSRPMQDLTKCLNANGAKIDGFKFLGKLNSGDFHITGKVSSQFISGLLFALPILDGDSKIIIEGDKVSKDYILITLEVINKFGIKIQETDYGYFVKGNQKYVCPKKMQVEGDYSGASFMLTMGALSDGVKVLNLNKSTSQGDRKIIDAIKLFGGIVNEVDGGYFVKKGELIGITLDCEDIPDLVQILSVIGAYAKGESRFLNVSRLKIKESDRIEGIIKNLKVAGVKAEYNGNDLIVYGGNPKGGVFSGDNDHRTVMSGAVLASFASGNSTILGAEAISKSYPNFFKDYVAIGGNISGDI